MNAAIERLDRLRRRMRETRTDLVALGPGSHMRWLLGFHPYPDERPCLLLVSAGKAAFVMPALNEEASRSRTDISFCVWRDEEGPRAAIAAALREVGIERARKIALDEEMRADFARFVVEALPGAEQRFGEETVALLRMRKDDKEIDLLRASAGIADRAMQKAFSAIRPGMTELDLAAVVEEHFVSEGATPSFRIIGAAGNGAFPHHHTSSRQLKRGDALVIDIGGRKDEYPSDITRMAVVGHAPDGYHEIHAVVEAAVIAALDAARPGVAARQVDMAARDVITRAGYGQHFVHRTGHGIGMDGHEQPYITGASETVLEEGMTFSIEPGIYLPGRFGVRLEEIVVLRQDGAEILSSLPRDLYIADTNPVGG